MLRDRKRKESRCVAFYGSKRNLASSRLCFENKLYKDSINRSFYVVFYVIKSILANISLKNNKEG